MSSRGLTTHVQDSTMDGITKDPTNRKGKKIPLASRKIEIASTVVNLVTMLLNAHPSESNVTQPHLEGTKSMSSKSVMIQTGMKKRKSMRVRQVMNSSTGKSILSKNVL